MNDILLAESPLFSGIPAQLVSEPILWEPLPALRFGTARQINFARTKRMHLEWRMPNMTARCAVANPNIIGDLRELCAEMLLHQLDSNFWLDLKDGLQIPLAAPPSEFAEWFRCAMEATAGRGMQVGFGG